MNQLDKRVETGKNATKTSDFKKAAKELRDKLGTDFKEEARDKLKQLGTGVIEQLKQQLMEALSMHGIDFLELFPCCPVPCLPAGSAPSGQVMNRGESHSLLPFFLDPLLPGWFVLLFGGSSFCLTY
jgi:hypothetical protein